MKTKPKLIICILIFVVGAVVNVFFSSAVHQILSQQSDVLKLVSFGDGIVSILSNKQHFMLFLCLQGFTVILSIMFYLTNLRPYQSDLREIVPGIQTPAAVGQHQHGSARWLDEKEQDKAFDNFMLDESHPTIQTLTDHGYDGLDFIKQKAEKIPKVVNFPLSSGGVVLGMRKETLGERIYYIGDDTHSLTIGATRSGKSRSIVLQSVCTLGLAGESMVISDPKAELFHYTAEYLKRLGYEVIALDFKNPDRSQRYNLLQPIINAAKDGNMERAEMLTWDMTNALVGKETGSGEKIWHNGEMSIVAAGILCVVCDNIKRPDYQNLTNVYWFLAEMCKQIGNKMPLLEYVKKLPQSHPAKALLSISDVAPSRTRGSFYTSALTTLRLFTARSIYAITSKSDFTLTDIGEKKQALFIILPDEKTSAHVVA